MFQVFFFFFSRLMFKYLSPQLFISLLFFPFSDNTFDIS